MPRANTLYNRTKLIALAEKFEYRGSELRRLADRLTENKLDAVVAKEPGRLALAHQATIDDGLSAARKFIHEADGKIDDMLDAR